MATDNRVFVIGVGMTKFERCETEVRELGQAAAKDALKDAAIDYDKIEQGFCGYINGMSTLGQQTLYGIGMTGIPVYNVNNNCSTGSTALFMAYNAIKFGQNDAVLALGFEKMQKGPLENQLPGLEKLKAETEKEKKPPIAARMFGDAGRDHMEKYGTKPATFAKIAVKNHRHSVNNPRSQYQEACTIDEVLAARMVYDPLTILQCCPTSDGAAAAVVVSERYLKAHPHPGAIEIRGMAMGTDRMEDFARGRIGMVGMGMTERTAQAGLRDVGHRHQRRAGRRAARLLQHQRADHLRRPGHVQGRRGREAGRGRGDDLRRPLGGEPVGRVAVEGPPARRHRPGAMRRARLAAARSSRETPGRRRESGAATQPRPRRRLRRGDVHESIGLRPAPCDD